MIEAGLLSFVYKILKDIYSWVRGTQRKLSKNEIIKLRQKWKNEFENKIFERKKAGLREDVIIRDMIRMDDYPDLNDKDKGISPWFKVGLIGTYHRGIQVGLRWETLTMDKKLHKWRYTNYEADEEGEIKVILIGFIPYENIETVDWDGDEYYGFPHIYCHFNVRSKEPYERLAFCEQKHLDNDPFYSEVVDLNSVQKISKKLSIQ